MIEHIFGVLKRQFRALQYPLKYNMYIQARLPVALCVIHNLICQYNLDVSFDEEFAEGEPGGDELPGVLSDGPADVAERRRVDEHCNNIAQEMWEDYQEELRYRARLEAEADADTDTEAEVAA